MAKLEILKYFTIKDKEIKFGSLSESFRWPFPRQWVQIDVN